MEKFRIAQYGLMQAVALAYGILSCGAVVKLGKPIVEEGYPMPPIYWAASFYRSYGITLYLIIIAWAAFAAYYSSPFPKQTIDDRWMIGSGIFLFIVLLVLGSVLAFGGGVAATTLRGPIQPL